MADSIPKLRRLLNEANARIRELESRAVPEPEVRVVEKPVLKEVEKVVYRDNPVARVETEKLVYCQDPAQEETIRQLQDQICRLTSQ